MRLETEKMLDTVRLTKDSFDIRKSEPDWNIVTDTLVPTAPKRVDTIVPVKISVEDIEVEQSEREVVPVSTQEVDSLVAKQPYDTIRKVESDRSKDEISTSGIRKSDTTSLVVTPMRTQVSDTVVSVEETSSTSFVSQLTIDTIVYTAVVDNSLVDTVSVLETSAISHYSLDNQKEGVALPTRLDRSDGVFALLLICFLLLAHVYNGGTRFFKENIMLVFSASKSEKLESQTTMKEIFYSYFLVFLATLLISITCYEALDRLIPLSEDEKRPSVTIGLFMGLILLFVLVKMTFNKLVGYIFDFEKKINTWNKSYLVMLSMLGLICFLPTLMLIYSDLWHSIIIGFVLVLFLIVQIVLFIRIIVFFVEQKFNFLYLIVYLCTIEILPYIFLGIGLVYLYRIDIFNTIL